MSSPIAESLAHRLLDAFPPRRVYTPAVFEHEPMPTSVAHFLKHWLRHRLRHEATRLELPRSDWFDYEHEAVQHARRDLAKALIQYGHFPAATWETSLREAIQQVTAYLVRPASTLTAFIFQEDQAVPANVLTWRLGYFKDYPYFKEAVQGYIQQEEGRDIEQAHLAEMLRMIDRKAAKGYDSDAWLALLAPLFDLVRRDGTGEGVPIALLLAFFKDKDAKNHTNRLSKHQQRQQVDVLDEDGLRQILKHGDAPPPPPLPPAMSPVAPEQEQGPVPRWKQFQLKQTTAPPPPPPKQPPKRPAPPPPPKVQHNPFTQEPRPRWMQFRGEEEPAPSSETPPVARPTSTDLTSIEHAVLGEAAATSRNLFIASLFGHSVEAYEDVLRQLHAIPSWPEASKVIADEVFRKFQVNIYSDSAILFTDAIEAQYLNRS